VREPSVLPVFGRLGVKAPVVIAAPSGSKRLEKTMTGLRAVLSVHGGMILKLSIVAWTVVVLAAVFFITKA